MNGFVPAKLLDIWLAKIPKFTVCSLFMFLQDWIRPTYIISLQNLKNYCYIGHRKETEDITWTP